MSTPMKHFYVDIESLYDLRAATIERLKPGHMEVLVPAGYHHRKSDIFEGIDPEEYRVLYDKFEDETLTQSYVTNVLYIVLVHLYDVLKEARVNEIHPDHLPRVYINTYPYEFDEGATQLLKQLVFNALERLVHVTVIRTPREELLPDYMRQQFYLAFMYQYNLWYSIHGKYFTDLIVRQEAVKDIIVMGPMVFMNSDPDTNEELQESLRNGINPLGLIQSGLESSGLRLLNPEIFSIIYPDRRVMTYDLPESSGGLTLEEYQAMLRDRGELT